MKKTKKTKQQKLHSNELFSMHMKNILLNGPTAIIIIRNGVGRRAITV